MRGGALAGELMSVFRPEGERGRGMTEEGDGADALVMMETR